MNSSERQRNAEIDASTSVSASNLVDSQSPDTGWEDEPSSNTSESVCASHHPTALRLVLNGVPSKNARQRKCSLAATANQIDRHFNRLTYSVKSAVFEAYSIGLLVLAYQDAAKQKKKSRTAAVDELARATGSGLSARQLYRYRQVAKAITDELQNRNISTFDTRVKESQFEELLGDRSLRQLLKELSVQREGAKAARQSGPAASPQEDEWYTPAEVIRCAMILLGGIDLDPCGALDERMHFASCATFTSVDDGLRTDRRWFGSVFVHAPASKSLQFVERAVSEVNSEAAEEALVFGPAITDADYMNSLKSFSRGFLHKRPTFATPSGEFVQPSMPYMLVFVTRALNRSDAFADACERIAHIYHPHSF